MLPRPILRIALLILAALAFHSARAASYTWTNIAGQPGGFGNVDGTGASARFGDPEQEAIDANGTIYIADSSNRIIRKLTPDGAVTTIAGIPGVSGTDDGPVSKATFDSPDAIAVGTDGTIYVADTESNTIRVISTSGTVTTIAGNSTTSGTDDGPAASALFDFPGAIAVDGSNNVFIADTDNSTIRELSGGIVTTFAGAPGQSGTDDGPGAAARFEEPSGIVVDGSGNLYVSDAQSNTIRFITSSGSVSTVAGFPDEDGGSADGTGTNARFGEPSQLTLDGSGNIYIADSGNNTIRKIDPEFNVTTLSGSAGVAGYQDGAGPIAQFHQPEGVVSSTSGTLFVTDRENEVIRQVSPSRDTTTLAGAAPTNGYINASGTNARFNLPDGIAPIPGGSLYVTDHENQVIRKIDSTGTVTLFAGTPQVGGTSDGTLLTAKFRFPSSIAVASTGDIYLVDAGNNTIRKIDPTANSVTTIAGMPGVSGTADGEGSSARFSDPQGIAVSDSGTLYVADTSNSTIRAISPSGKVTTIAGSPGLTGTEDGTGSLARFHFPDALTLDNQNHLFIADQASGTIRELDLANNHVTTFAGAPDQFAYIDGPLAVARFDDLEGISADANGNLYVATDTLIREISSSGIVSTIGGSEGLIGGADGVGAAAQFSEPSGIAASADGSTLYVADSHNNSISRGILLGAPQFIAATGAPVPNTAGSTYKAIASPQVGIFYGTVKTGKTTTTAIFRPDGTILAQTGGSYTKLGTPSGDMAVATKKGGTQTLLIGLLTGTATETFATGKSSSPLNIDKILAIDGFNGTYDYFLATVTVNSALAGIPTGKHVALFNFSNSILHTLAYTGEGVTVGTTPETIKTLTTLIGSKGTLADERWVGTGGTAAFRATFTDKKEAIFLTPPAVASPNNWSFIVATGTSFFRGPDITSFGLPTYSIGNPAFIANFALGLGSIDSSNNAALATADPSVTLPKGDPTADGLGNEDDGAHIAAFSDPVSGASNAYAFEVKLTGTSVKPATNQGLYFSGDGFPLVKVARTGDSAPGGGHFAAFTSMVLPTYPAESGSGGPIFTAKLVTTKADSVTPANNTGLYAYDSANTLQLLFRAGQTISVNGGPKTVKSFTALLPALGASGAANGYTQDGLVAVLAKLNDGTTALINVGPAP